MRSGASFFLTLMSAKEECRTFAGYRVSWSVSYSVYRTLAIVPEDNSTYGCSTYLIIPFVLTPFIHSRRMSAPSRAPSAQEHTYRGL